jgi:hypothetical protein
MTSLNRAFMNALRFGPNPDGSIAALLQSTRGAWTDAPDRRACVRTRQGYTSLQFPVDKTPEFGYMGWKQLTQATRLTVRKDRKIKGFQLTR